MRPRIVWENWIREHSARLLLYARRWTRDRGEAEDWVQDAFTRFWPRRDDVKDPILYLYRCIRTIAVDASRRRLSEKRRDDELRLNFDQNVMFSCSIEQAEWRQQVESSLSHLPLEQGEVVTLKIWSQLTFAQIAELTNSPIGTVASRYRYAMKTLETLLTEHQPNA